MPNELDTTLPGAAAADNALIEAAVAEINSIWDTGYLTSVSQVGALVLDRFFGGDIENARSRRREHASYKAVSKHPDLQIGSTTLWYCVTIFDQLPLLDTEVANRLSFAHHKLLVHVTDIELRRRLASQAATDQQTTLQLTAAIDATRETPPAGTTRQRPGPVPAPPAIKGLNQATKSIESLHQVTEASLRALDTAKREEALTKAREFAEQVAAWWAAIQAIEASPPPPED